MYPWHYPHPFFQEVNLSYLEDPAITVKTVTSKLTNWFQEIGLDIKDILKNSDISANEDKSAANFWIHIFLSNAFLIFNILFNILLMFFNVLFNVF